MDNKEFLNISAKQDKEVVDLYHQIATSFSLSETEMWIIYFIANSDTPLSQIDLVNIVMSPKQTINSATKRLIESDMVVLHKVDRSKNKIIFLTDKGNEFADKTVRKLYEAEILSADNLSDKEKETIIKIRYKFIKGLLKEFKGND